MIITASLSSHKDLQTPGKDHIPSFMRRVRISRLKCCSSKPDGEKHGFRFFGGHPLISSCFYFQQSKNEPLEVLSRRSQGPYTLQGPHIYRPLVSVPRRGLHLGTLGPSPGHPGATFGLVLKWFWGGFRVVWDGFRVVL